MKRTLAFLLALCMLLSTAACSSPATDETTKAPQTTEAAPETPATTEPETPAAFTAGTYTGTATSIGGTIQLEVTFSETQLVNVTCSQMYDTRYVFEQAFAPMIEAAISGQTLNIDSVSGATFSSFAIRTALEDAAQQAGALEALSAAPAYNAAAIEYDLEADVIVVGSGMAGLTAAMTALEAGAEVILLEKLDIAGGSSMLSEGCYSGTTDEASVQPIIDNLVVTSEFLPTKYSLDMDKITRTANEIPSAHSWLDSVLQEEGIAEELTVFKSPFLANFYVGENNDKSVNTDDARWNLACTGIWPTVAGSYHGADYIIKMMVQNYLDNGGKLYTSTPATKLLTDANGAIIGVEATTDDAVLTFQAPAVILACGGSGRNTDLLCERDSDDETYACIGATGDAILLGTEIGAAIYDNQQILTNSGRIYPINLFNGVAYSQTPFTSMYVDDNGNRLVAEDIWMTLIHAAFRTDGRDHYYSIANAAVLDAYTLPYGDASIKGSNMLELVESRLEQYPDYYIKANTIEELADKLGMPDLAATLEEYNEGCRTGNDKFGKTSDYLVEMAEGPYYAIYATQYGPGTMGGVVSNSECQVLNTAGEAIPGLYVAGEASNGAFFTEAYMCTHMMGLCLGTGRIAGANAAEYVK